MTTLLVASAGGHIAELHALLPRLPVDGNRAWVTFDTPQTRDLLGNELVAYALFAGSRDARGTLKDALFARRVFARSTITSVISTGSSIAAAFFLHARARGIPCHYIDSATRVNGPSLTGRLVQFLPGVHLYTQNADWASGRWVFAGSVFDDFEVKMGSTPVQTNKVVVSLGTRQEYSFRRLVERLAPMLKHADVYWQIAPSDADGLGIANHGLSATSELEAIMREADLVITHAGVGSASTALKQGRRSVLIPRRQEFAEHVDDHQVDLGRVLSRKGLAVVREAEEVSEADLQEAAAALVITRQDKDLFPLTEPRERAMRRRDVRHD